MKILTTVVTLSQLFTVLLAQVPTRLSQTAAVIQPTPVPVSTKPTKPKTKPLVADSPTGTTSSNTTVTTRVTNTSGGVATTVETVVVYPNPAIPIGESSISGVGCFGKSVLVFVTLGVLIVFNG